MGRVFAEIDSGHRFCLDNVRRTAFPRDVLRFNAFKIGVGFGDLQGALLTINRGNLDNR
jgi:hypothetical protein